MNQLVRGIDQRKNSRPETGDLRQDQGQETQMVGKRRAPCCDKTKVKRGPWSPAEDFRLISFMQKHGHTNWHALPQQAGLLRCGKSCRLRWINYLRPEVKRGNFSPEEEETIIRLHKSIGNKWSKIASHLPGRTDNEIKNVWNTHLKKRLGRNEATSDQNESKDSSTSYSASPSPSSGSCISYGDLNLDRRPGVEEAQESVAGGTDDQKQDGKFSAVIMQAQRKPIDEPKEESISPSHSNTASNVQSLMSTVEVSRSMEETASLLDSNEPSEVQTIMNTRGTQGDVSDEKIEIPFESDVDFWSMLDTLNPIQSWEYQPQEHEVSKAESTNFGVGAEFRKWLKYLENELGLDGETDSDCQQKAAHEELVMKTSDNELIFRPEIDPAMSYFSIWPSPPHDFGF